MAILSNCCFFPFVQFALLAVLIYAVWRDLKIWRGRRSGNLKMTVNRAEKSMKTLDKITGLVIAAIITIINKSVFDEDKTWSHYAAFFNSVDILAIVYVCYFSPWGRNLIIGWQISSEKEKR